MVMGLVDGCIVEGGGMIGIGGIAWFLDGGATVIFGNNFASMMWGAYSSFFFSKRQRPFAIFGLFGKV